MKYREAKVYKNRFRNEVREFLTNCRKDWGESVNRDGAKPYAFLVDRFAVEWMDWDPRSNTVLMCVYDRKYGKVDYNSPVCKYVRIPLDYRFAFSRLWEVANEVACNMQMKEYR